MYAAEPAAHTYNPWLEIPICFDRRDHLTSIRHGGKAVLIVDPIVEGYHLTKVLMDGGKKLNLIFADTFQKMSIDESCIDPTKTRYKDIIPDMEASCTGRVTLDVVFSTPDNYRLEPLSFEIVHFKSGYHALLGRTAFARFGVVPHFAYLKLKMSGPNGVITISRNI